MDAKWLTVGKGWQGLISPVICEANKENGAWVSGAVLLHKADCFYTEAGWKRPNVAPCGS